MVDGRRRSIRRRNVETFSVGLCAGDTTWPKFITFDSSFATSETVLVSFSHGVIATAHVIEQRLGFASARVDARVKAILQAIHVSHMEGVGAEASLPTSRRPQTSRT